jgi:hypothetical protein
MNEVRGSLTSPIGARLIVGNRQGINANNTWTRGKDWPHQLEPDDRDTPTLASL